jgi:hypothetical protein
LYAIPLPRDDAGIVGDIEGLEGQQIARVSDVLPPLLGPTEGLKRLVPLENFSAIVPVHVMTRGAGENILPHGLILLVAITGLLSQSTLANPSARQIRSISI